MSEKKITALRLIFPEHQIIDCIKKYGFYVKGESAVKSAGSSINGSGGSADEPRTTKGLISSLPSVIYFAVVMWWIIAALPLVPLGMLANIITVCTSSFPVQNIGLIIISVFGFFIGFSALLAPVRIMYYKLPWLFSYVAILYVNVIIMSGAAMILNYGYEVQSSTRHMLFLAVMLCEIVASRAVMSVYFYLRRIKYVGGDGDE